MAFVNIRDIGDDFILVTNISEETISYVHRHKKTITVSKDIFLNREKGNIYYKNIIWKAELNEQSGELEYDEKRKEEKLNSLKKAGWIIAAIIVLLLVFAANLSNNNMISLIIIFLLKMIGLSVNSLLLVYEIDKNNAFVKNICSVSGKTNCDAVLSSKAAKIGGISWGEMGFFYFASTTIGLLLPNLPYNTKVTCLAVANIFAVPFIFFSIYYQWRVIKQWCFLCLTVQFILVSELIWGITEVLSSPFTAILQPFTIIAAIIFCVLLPIVLWYSLKPKFIKANNHDLYLTAYKRLQYNPYIFNNLLKQQTQAPDGWQALGINIGNPEAANTIIKICNPYCGPCDKAHPQLEEIIKHNNDVKLKIIFTSRNHESDRGAAVVKHLLAIAAEGNAIKTQTAIDDWYLNVKKDYEVFATKHPVNGDLKEQEKEIDTMSEWCTTAQVTHTPTIFVNGFRLPEDYLIKELKYIF